MLDGTSETCGRASDSNDTPSETCPCSLLRNTAASRISPLTCEAEASVFDSLDVEQDMEGSARKLSASNRCESSQSFSSAATLPVSSLSQLLRCQELYFFTSKASKLSTNRIQESEVRCSPQTMSSKYSKKNHSRCKMMTFPVSR